MKIYTKKGDAGQTSLIGGTRVEKDHIRIEAYGTLDELNSWMGILRDHAVFASKQTLIQNIQDKLFVMGSDLASDPGKSKMKLPELQQADVDLLETDMDEMDDTLPALTNFVLPGGHSANSHAHVARCVCRRAERCAVSLNHISPIEPLILSYLNRLSDWLFVLARYASQQAGAREILWNSK